MDYLIPYIIMNVMFFSYVLGITLRYGVQTSISESYYRLPRNLQWLFTIATWGYAFPAIIIGVPYSGLAFLAGSGICFVGASPAFKSLGLENIVHMVGAGIGVTASQLFISLVLGQWWITLCFVLLSGLCYLIPKMKTNILWWVEILAFLSMVVSYGILVL